MNEALAVRSRADLWWLALVVVFLYFACSSTSVFCFPRSQQADSKRRIDDFMRTLNERGQFSGAVLVGDADGILYEAAYDQANRADKTKFTTGTQSCLASLSKPFTALAVMMLVRSWRPSSRRPRVEIC